MPNSSNEGLGGLKRSASRTNLGANLAGLGDPTHQAPMVRAQAIAAPAAGSQPVLAASQPSALPDASSQLSGSPISAKSGLLKRSRSIGAFESLMGSGPSAQKMGQEAVESISGKVTLARLETPKNLGTAVGSARPVASPTSTDDGHPTKRTVHGSDSNSNSNSTSSSTGDTGAPLSPASSVSSSSTGKASPRSPPSAPLMSPDSLVLDDTHIQRNPLTRVDYFSHDWNEMDIAGSWRYIVSRRNDMANSARLENASWRTWAKAKNNLKTVSPETVNWLKDYDVTWLYGPLYHEDGSDSETEEPTVVSTAKKSLDDSAATARGKHGKKATPTVKSILKKKTIAQIMMEDAPGYVQESGISSTTNYLRHHNYRHSTGTNAQHMASLVNQQYSRTASAEDTTMAAAMGGAGAADLGLAHSQAQGSQSSLDPSERHVHFNVRVEQCIALDPEDGNAAAHVDGVGYTTVSSSLDDEETSTDGEGDASDDDEGGLFLGIRRKGSNANLVGSQTIAPLPATTLKYAEDEAAGDQDSAQNQDHEKEKTPEVEARALGSQSSRRPGYNANYDYGSVYPSNAVAYKIVDPKVKAVELPSSVALEVSESTSSPPSPRKDGSTTQQQQQKQQQQPKAEPEPKTAPAKRRTVRPVCSFGVDC